MVVDMNQAVGRPGRSDTGQSIKHYTTPPARTTTITSGSGSGNRPPPTARGVIIMSNDRERNSFNLRLPRLSSSIKVISPRKPCGDRGRVDKTGSDVTGELRTWSRPATSTTTIFTDPKMLMKQRYGSQRKSRTFNLTRANGFKRKVSHCNTQIPWREQKNRVHHLVQEIMDYCSALNGDDRQRCKADTALTTMTTVSPAAVEGRRHDSALLPPALERPRKFR
ncbi:hypothetical protein BaRGS_00039098, partial [Batillaria attramentaria]